MRYVLFIFFSHSNDLNVFVSTILWGSPFFFSSSEIYHCIGDSQYRLMCYYLEHVCVIMLNLMVSLL